MKKINETYLNNLVSKLLNETLEEKADALVSKIKKEVGEGEITGEHPTFGKMNFATMSDEEIDALMRRAKGDEDDDNNESEWDEVHSDEDDDTIEDEFDFQEMDELFDTPEMKSKFDKDYKFNPKHFGAMDKSSKFFKDEFKGGKFEKPKKHKDEDEDFELVESEVCNECGGMMTEGECVECGYKMEGIYDESEPFGKEQSFDYVEEEMNEESEEDMENEEFCKYQFKNFGPEDERFKEKCKNMSEALVGGQKKLDKNKNGKIDTEDFKMLRKQNKKGGETDEQWQALAADMAVAAAPAVATWALNKTFGGENTEGTKKKGFPDLSGDGKVTRKDILMGRGVKLKESIKLTENELINLIEKIVKEQKAGMKTLGKPKGLTKYEQVHKADGKENQEYLNMVAKKMKDYLKDGSKGDYEMNPKHFPKGNGELGEMKKKAYKPSDAVQDYTDNFTAAGQENLMFDEIHPNEERMTKHIEGSSETGNNPKWANAVETPVNKKRNKIRKDNLLGAVKRQAYNKAPQPVVSDEAGETTIGGKLSINVGKGSGKKANKILSQLESVEPKEEKKLNEEFGRMKDLISYDRKTQ